MSAIKLSRNLQNFLYGLVVVFLQLFSCRCRLIMLNNFLNIPLKFVPHSIEGFFKNG